MIPRGLWGKPPEECEDADLIGRELVPPVASPISPPMIPRGLWGKPPKECEDADLIGRELVPSKPGERVKKFLDIDDDVSSYGVSSTGESARDSTSSSESEGTEAAERKKRTNLFFTRQPRRREVSFRYSSKGAIAFPSSLCMGGGDTKFRRFCRYIFFDFGLGFLYI